MTRTQWTDETTALRERIDRFPSKKHPAVRGLIRKLDDLMQVGLTHEFITPREAARA
jgi:hypothetical protein